MNIQTDRAFIPAGSTAIRYFTVTITAPAVSLERQTERPAVHVALVLDRSGSMAGRKIEMAKKAVDHAVRLLNERDRLALVCYDNEIDTLLGATSATPEAKALAVSRLRKIDARGSTDLCGGWLKGAEEVGTTGATGTTGTTGTVTRVLLLSDGLANQGETDPAVLARHAADLRAKGIATSTFGLGADFDERLMSKLATDGGGHFYFIEQPAQIPDFFTSELGEALEVVARDVRLVISGDAGVWIGCLNEFPAETTGGVGGGGEVQVRLGDLVASQQVTVVIAVRCPAGVVGDRVSVGVRLADRDHALFPQPMPIEWQVVDQAADAAQPVNADVLIEAAKLLAERARAAALEANRRGDFDEAAKVLKRAAVDLRALAPGVREIEAIATELEAEQPDYGVLMPAYEMKARHFASYNQSSGRDRQGKARKRDSVS